MGDRGYATPDGTCPSPQPQPARRAIGHAPRSAVGPASQFSPRGGSNARRARGGIL